MNYNIDERYNAVVIHLKGNVMGGPDGSDLRDTLDELKDDEKTNVVVDVSRVNFMNSSGLGLLVGGLTSMRNAGGDVRLANVADRIRSLLIITKLITIFKTYESVDEAVESFEEDPPEEGSDEE
jgi:anti-sigma B factor antagonist